LQCCQPALVRCNCILAQISQATSRVTQAPERARTPFPACDVSFEMLVSKNCRFAFTRHLVYCVQGLKVHQGFQDGWAILSTGIYKAVQLYTGNKWTTDQTQKEHAQKWTVFVTGHSLGGAMATLCAYYLAKTSCALSVLPDPPHPPALKAQQHIAHGSRKTRYSSGQRLQCSLLFAPLHIGQGSCP
jgi:Lipase (class 3)